MNTNTEFLNIKNKMKEFEFEGENFAIISANNINDFVVEGNELKHAVGHPYYVNKIMKGDMTVLFLRKKRDIEKPFYTISIEDNKVTMIKGLHNKEITLESHPLKDNLEHFIRDWKIAKNLN